VVYEQFALSSLGCGWLGRAALRLELERWYVGTAVPEGGVGGLPGVVEQLDVGAAAPKALCVVCIETLSWVTRFLDVGRRRCVALLFWGVDFFIFVGASRVCSSHSTHGVFSLALVGGRLVLWGGVVWALPLLYRF
jgi:hypothetical protein